MSIPESHTNASASSDTNSSNGSRFYQGSSLPPEILHMIMENLPPESLVRCTLVNREFKRIASPLVWIVHHDPQTKRKKLGPEYRQCLVNNAHKIQSIKIRSEDTLDFFCPRSRQPGEESAPQPSIIELPQLQELELAISFRINTRNSPPDYPRILGWVEATFSSLNVLNIGNLIPPEMAISIAHSRQLRLTDISLRTELSVSEATLLLRELPSHVQSLSLDAISGYRLSPVDEPRRPFTTNHHALRTLHLNTSCYIKSFDRFLVPFLGTCSSNLKSFRAYRPNSLLNANVRAALEKLGIQAGEVFTHNDMESTETVDNDIANKVSAYTHLEMVLIPDLKNVGPRTIETIFAHSEILRLVELPNYASITSTDVVRMLSSLKRLETFIVSGPMSVPFSPPPSNLVLSTAEVVSVQWATKSLRVFTCPIQVHRLASDVPEQHRIADLTCEDQGESWTIQRQVLRRLAEQTNLTSLDFSIHIAPARCSPQWYSLEMSKDSGLEELGKLTKLENLLIDQLNHGMGPRDIQWVEETWNEPHFRFHRSDREQMKYLAALLRQSNQML